MKKKYRSVAGCQSCLHPATEKLTENDNDLISEGGEKNLQRQFPAMPTTIWVKRTCLVRMEMMVGARWSTSLMESKPGRQSRIEIF